MRSSRLVSTFSARSLVLAVACAAVAGCAAAPSAADADRWEEAIRAFEDADLERLPPLGANLFLGSSSIRLWDLEASFPGYPVVRRGFGGSEVADSVRYAPRIVLPLRPRTIVVYAGDNDIARGKTPEAVRDDFQALVDLVGRELPGARVVFLSIKPSLARWHLADPMRRANDLICALADVRERVEFIDVWPVMLGADGRPRRELLLEDGLHLSADGYRLWASIVRPYLVR